MSIKRQIFGFELKTSLNLKIILFKQNTTTGDRCTGIAGSYQTILKVMGLLTLLKSESGQSLTYLRLNGLVLFSAASVVLEMLSEQEALSCPLLASLDAIFPSPSCLDFFCNNN